MLIYQFCRKDGEPVTFGEVAERLQSDAGMPADNELNCVAYQYVVEAGIAILSSTKEQTVTPKVVRKYFEVTQEDTPDGEINEAFRDFIEKYAPYLDGTIYTFKAWR